jgi:hypothetical protein
MQQRAGTKGAIAETSTPNCRLAFSCESAAVGATRRQLHLLLLDERFTHQLGHHRLHEARADPFSLPEARAVRDDVLVVAGVGVRLRYRLVVSSVHLLV